MSDILKKLEADTKRADDIDRWYRDEIAKVSKERPDSVIERAQLRASRDSAKNTILLGEDIEAVELRRALYLQSYLLEQNYRETSERLKRIERLVGVVLVVLVGVAIKVF